MVIIKILLTYLSQSINSEEELIVSCRADINECESVHNACVNGQCVNNQGSYRCECRLGFTLATDGKTCLGQWSILNGY